MDLQIFEKLSKLGVWDGSCSKENQKELLTCGPQYYPVEKTIPLNAIKVILTPSIHEGICYKELEFVYHVNDKNRYCHKIVAYKDGKEKLTYANVYTGPHHDGYFTLPCYIHGYGLNIGVKLTLQMTILTTLRSGSPIKKA